LSDGIPPGACYALSELDKQGRPVRCGLLPWSATAKQKLDGSIEFLMERGRKRFLKIGRVAQCGRLLHGQTLAILGLRSNRCTAKIRATTALARCVQLAHAAT